MIKLKLLYGKKLGLPNYSSHEASACVETELRDLSEANEQIDYLYSKLQEAIDTQMQTHPGFVPCQAYGSQSNQGTLPQNNPQQPENHASQSGPWRCSEKQRSFIERIIKENNLPLSDVDHLARQRFGTPVAKLNKMQASGLIDALLDQYGSKGKGGTR